MYTNSKIGNEPFFTTFSNTEGDSISRIKFLVPANHECYVSILYQDGGHGHYEYTKQLTARTEILEFGAFHLFSEMESIRFEFDISNEEDVQIYQLEFEFEE